jgi:uncharacterized protein (DUF362 family)
MSQHSSQTANKGMQDSRSIDRRDFITRTSTAVVGAGLVGAGMAGNADAFDIPVPVPTISGKSRVALTQHDSRRRAIHDALAMIGDEIKRDVGNRQIVIKPNCVSAIFGAEHSEATTNADALRGILDFLKPWYKGRPIIAEDPASSDRSGKRFGDAAVAYRQYGYLPLAEEYGAEFRDLAEYGGTPVYMLDPEFRPIRINIAKLMLDPNTYLISAAVMKVHNLVGVTLSAKNIMMAAPVKGGDEKYKMHIGSREKNFRTGPRDPKFNKMINHNLFRMAHYAQPNLAVIDGYIAMEKRGPAGGDPVPMHCAVAGTDYIAADRIGTDLMGIPFEKIGHLAYSAEAKIGNGDLANIEVLGERVAAHRREFVRPDQFDTMTLW